MLRRLAAMSGLGLALGLPGAILAGQLLGALLYGVSPHDPALLIAVSGLLVSVALTAAVIRLRRALRTIRSSRFAMHDNVIT
jgi:putative ABC transport system permease protein